MYVFIMQDKHVHPHKNLPPHVIVQRKTTADCSALFKRRREAPKLESSLHITKPAQTKKLVMSTEIEHYSSKLSAQSCRLPMSEV